MLTQYMIPQNATKELSNVMVVVYSNAPEDTANVRVCCLFVSVCVSCIIYIVRSSFWAFLVQGMQVRL